MSHTNLPETVEELEERLLADGGADAGEVGHGLHHLEVGAHLVGQAFKGDRGRVNFGIMQLTRLLEENLRFAR